MSPIAIKISALPDIDAKFEDAMKFVNNDSQKVIDLATCIYELIFSHYSQYISKEEAAAFDKDYQELLKERKHSPLFNLHSLYSDILHRIFHDFFAQLKAQGTTQRDLSSQKVELIQHYRNLGDHSFLVDYCEKDELELLLVKEDSERKKTLLYDFFQCKTITSPDRCREFVQIVIELGADPNTLLKWSEASGVPVRNYQKWVNPSYLSFLVFSGAKTEQLNKEIQLMMATAKSYEGDENRTFYEQCLKAIPKADAIKKRATQEIPANLCQKLGQDLRSLGSFIPEVLLNLMVQYVGITQKEILAKCLQIEVLE